MFLVVRSSLARCFSLWRRFDEASANVVAFSEFFFVFAWVPVVVFQVFSTSNPKVQKNVNLIDLAKRFPMSIWLQKSASIQKRTSLLKFEDHRFCRSQFRSQAEPLVVRFWRPAV